MKTKNRDRALRTVVTNQDLSPAARLRMWRSGRGLDLGEAAVLLDCVKSTLSRIENGKGKPGRDLAVRIERETGLPVADWAKEAAP